MDLQTYLKNAVMALEYKDIPTARLDAIVLLEDTLGKDRAWLLSNPDLPLNEHTIEELNKLVKRRAQHEPLSYIRGKSEFYGREFLVTPATLQPRAETETMLDLLKGIGIRDTGTVFVDIGTGSGCIAITTKLEFPEAKVYATEINEDALKVAKKNAKKLEANVTFLQGNLLQPLLSIVSGLSSILLCNLPYVPNAHTINQAAMQEPKVAIFGGEDGLDLYRELFEQIEKSKVRRPEYIFTESLPFQHKELASIARAAGYRQVAEEDFIQVFKTTSGTFAK